MDGVNQNNQAQQAAPEQKQEPNKKNISDKQANDFADQVNKDSKKKEGSGKKDDQSLESLLAERSKSAKNAVEGRMKDQREGGQGGQSGQSDGQHKESVMGELGLIKGNEVQIKADVQIREMQQAASVKEVNAALQKMADQIHVTAKSAVNGAEIRITMKDSVMPDTEIRIMRNAGELTVTLNTKSAEANNFMAAHEASLQKTLSEKFAGEKVNVNINMSGGDNPEDGRSRNQYTNEDNNEDDNT